MTRRLATPAWLVLTLVVCFAGSAPAARPESLEVRDHGASRGLLTITVMDDGSAYIAPDHLAALLKGAWAVKGDRGTLTVGTRVAEFTRGQTRAIVHGQAVALDLPPRVTGREWLVSRDFLGKGLPRLAPGVSLALPTEARKPAAKTVQAVVPLEELRYRSYPSFTRIVIETGARLAYAVVTSEEEVRVRLPGLALARARASRRSVTVSCRRSASSRWATSRCCAWCSRAPRGK